MNKNHLLTLILALFIGSSVTAQIRQIKEKADGISNRLQHEIDMTKDPHLGYVPKIKLIQAEETRLRLARLNADRANLNWQERGPFKDAVGPSNGNTRPGTGAITSGRIRAVWVDLNDATGNTVWVGGIAGGIWKTTNVNARPSTWTNINDFLGNLAVSSITQDPSNTQIMYFGTGEKALNFEAVRGAGVWSSANNGVSWSLMPGTENFYNVSKVVCDATGNLYVACNSLSNPNSGLKRYTKATGIWEDITPAGLDKRVTEMVISSNGRLHIVCGYYNSTTAASGYRYTSNPSTVAASTWTAPASSFDCRYNVAMAVSGNALFALPSTSAFQVTTIYKSTDGGATWAATAATPGFTSGQGWYCMAVAIDPNNSNNAIVGSLDCYRTTNGGTSWSKISNWVGTTGQYVHADQQSMVWTGANRVLVTSDGGLHLSNDGGTTFSDRNEGLRIKQFFGVAVHPTLPNYFLAGAQDNGTHQLNGAGLTTSVEVTGGDGMFCHIDQTDGNIQFASYVRNEYHRSTNGGTSWSNITYSTTAGRFLNPTDYDDVGNNFYAAGATNQYVLWANANTSSTFATRSVTQLGGGQVSTIKVSPYTSNRVFFGSQLNTAAAKVVRVDNANAASPVITDISAGLPTTVGIFPSSIDMGTSDQNLMVCYANYGISNLWVSSDAGVTWTAIEGNLPDMPVRWAMFYPGDNTKAIIATETGVWQTSLINGASTIWAPETNFPNTRTDMLQYRASDGLLAAATHGRGIFTANLAAVVSCSAVTGLAAASTTTSGSTLSWAAAAGATNYDVSYKLATSTSWTTLVNGTTATLSVISGLASNSLYDYRVRANCASGSGAYTQAQFTTLAGACGTPTGLGSSAITSSGATVSWGAVSGASNYSVQYKLASATTWTTATGSTTNLSFVLTGLTASSNYDYRVAANCSGTAGSYAQGAFTTTASTSTCPGTYDNATNGAISGAATIPFNTDVFGTIGVNGDRDYYKFTITNGGTATITLSNLPANYDLYLFNSTGGQITSSRLSGTNTETISRTYTAGVYYAQARGRNTAFNATLCYTMRVQLGTATESNLEFGEPIAAEIEKLTLNVFPNPSQERVNIYVVGKGASKLEIYDITGKSIYAQDITDMLTTLDIKDIQSGMYVVKIKDANNEDLATQKFIKE